MEQDAFEGLAFYAGIIVGCYFLLEKLASLAWSALTSVWSVIILAFGTIISAFFLYRAAGYLLPARIDTDVKLAGIEYEDLEDEIPSKNEPIMVQPAPVPQELPKRDVRIDTYALLRKAAHWRDFLSPDEQEYLLRQGYELKHFVPLGEMRAQPCLIRKNGVESYEHTFVVNMVAEELRKYARKVNIHLTQYPDIVFECKGKQWAVEVETPLGLPKKHRRLALKAQETNKKYGSRWVIVVTQSAYAKSFRRYAKVLRRNDVTQWVADVFGRAVYTVPQNCCFGRAGIDDTTGKKAAVPGTNTARLPRAESTA